VSHCVCHCLTYVYLVLLRVPFTRKCHVLGARVTKWRILVRMIGFIGASVTLCLLITTNTALSLIYTLSSSPLHKHENTTSPLVVSWQRNSTQKLALQITMKSSCYFVFNHPVLLCPNLYSTDLHSSLRTRSILVPVLSTAEPSWTLWALCYDRIKHPFGSYDQIFFTVRQLRVCWCGALSLTRERVCSSQLLLVLASIVILGSESHGTRDHFYCLRFDISLFHRLLRLSGLRWRYSTPSHHGRESLTSNIPNTGSRLKIIIPPWIF
jgi:hypothetical protein